jgi:hypothetical protein
MTSFLLDSHWDIGLDANGNFAIATGNLAIAQDVACACRVFRGELWYDNSQGMPYQQILGERPSLQFVKQALIGVGQTVPNVGSLAVFLTGPGNDRQVGGQIQIMSATGTIIAVTSATSFAGDAPWWVSALPATS